MSIVKGKDTAAAARWSVGGVFLEGLANRDYASMATILAPNVRFGALLPPARRSSRDPTT